MIEWTTPAYTEINMSAEIGGYQDDFEEHAPKPDATIRPGDAAQSVADAAQSAAQEA